MSDLQEDISRGCLENGEPIEAKWGTGWWSGIGHEQEPEWGGGECPNCGKEAHYFGGKFVECEECGEEEDG